MIFTVSLCAEPHTGEKMQPSFGVYITNLYGFDYQDNTFKIVGALWSRYDAKYKNYDPTKITHINSEEFNSIETVKYQKDGLSFFGQKFTMTAFHQWDMVNFPFDKQVLKIEFEDLIHDESIVQYIPDTKNSGQSSDISISGWNIIDSSIGVNIFLYDTNFGEINDHKIGFSRVTSTITVKRDWVRPFINYFSAFLLSFLLSFMAMIIHPSEIGSKFSLTLGSVFSLISNNYILEQILPVQSSFTLADKIESATFIYIMSAVIFNSYEITLMFNNNIKKRLKILLWLLPLVTIAYMVYVGFCIYLAYIS